MGFALTDQMLLQSALLKSIYRGNSQIQSLGCSVLTKIYSKACTDSRHISPAGPSASSLQPLPQLLVRTHLTQLPPSEYCNVNISP